MEVNKQISEFKVIMNMIEIEYIKEDSPVIIMEGYEYFREVNSLFCRVHNLLDAIYELLISNMAEEAYILFRSLLNYHMVIIHLLKNYQDAAYLDEYLMQPVLGRIKFLNNIKNIYNKPWFVNLNNQNNTKITTNNIDKEISELKKLVKQKKFEGKKFTSNTIMQFQTNCHMDYI